MKGDRDGRRRLWRWRNNALRRRDDLIEAWIVLAVWAVVVVGGTVAGLVSAHAADDVFSRQRAERHSTRAVLITTVPAAVSGVEGAHNRVAAEIRWTADDGSARTDKTLVETGQKAGTKIAVWLDARSELTTEPPSRTEAAYGTALLGTAAALTVTGMATGAGALARRPLDRRRIDQWGTEWKRMEPQWRHRTG
ncbi:Rv1733c family protein [Streptomyces sp. GLT-R25]